MITNLLQYEVRVLDDVPARVCLPDSLAELVTYHFTTRPKHATRHETHHRSDSDDKSLVPVALISFASSNVIYVLTLEKLEALEAEAVSALH